MKRYCATASIIATIVVGVGAEAKDLTVNVDGRAAPWHTSVNSKMPFGLSDARAPRVVIDSAFRAGIMVTLSAKGMTHTSEGGPSFGPRGDTSWPYDRGMALFPSHYIKSKGAVFLNGLVGTFISADGMIVGEPFAIGEGTSVRVPEGSAALSLGINDDRFSDNGGTLVVDVHIPEASVIVESRDDTK